MKKLHFESSLSLSLSLSIYIYIYIYICRLRDLLCKLGFCFVWLQKNVGNERAFLWQFSRNYSVVILTKSGLPLLTAVRDFVCMHHLNPAYLQENYLDCVRIICFRDALIKLRMGVLPLNADRFRYAHENASKILCSVCESETEDEEHFICSSEIHSPVFAN